MRRAAQGFLQGNGSKRRRGTPIRHHARSGLPGLAFHSIAVPEVSAVARSGIQETLTFEHAPHLFESGSNSTDGKSDLTESSNVRELLTALLE